MHIFHNAYEIDEVSYGLKREANHNLAVPMYEPRENKELVICVTGNNFNLSFIDTYLVLQRITILH